MATPAPAVLDLVTEHERSTVRIDHIDYALRSARDLTLAEYRELERISPRIGLLLLTETLSGAETQELGQLLDRACRIAVAAPDDVHARLGDVLRVQIFDAFIARLSPSLPPTSAPRGPVAPSAGRKPSRSSSGSTGARPRRGPGRRRTGSSRPV